MLKYSMLSVTSLNIYLARRVVIILLISGTLITSVAVTGQTFATKIGKPDIGIEDGIIIEGGAEDEEETDESGDETTSERAVPGEQFCKKGTGGAFDRPCIPCDPGLPLPGCVDVSTDGPLMQGDEAGLRNETGTSTEPILQYAQKLKELQAIKDPSQLVILKLQDLENGGKLPAQTTEKFKSALKGDPNSLKTLCDIASTSKSGFVKSMDCDSLPTQPTNGTNVAMEPLLTGILLGIVGSLLYDVLKNDVDSFPTDCVLGAGSSEEVAACFT